MYIGESWESVRRSTIVIGLALLTAVGISILIVTALDVGLPILGQKSVSFVALLVPALLTIGCLLVRGDAGFGIVVFLATALIARTGMQLDIGALRTSALEVLVFASGLVLLTRQVLFRDPPRWPRLVLDRPWTAFALLTVPAVIVAVARQVPLVNIVGELKAYFLYPVLAYILVAWATTVRRWKLLLLAGVAAASLIALSGIDSWFQRGSVVDLRALSATQEDRVSGAFGIINQYGFYLSSLIPVTVALVSSRLPMTTRSAGFLGIILLAGMALAGSRGAWIGTVIGVGAFLVARRPARSHWLVAIAVLAAALLWQSRYLEARFLASPIEDRSRLDFLDIGWEAFKQFPIFGAGWGASFYLDSTHQLQTVNQLVQLHNDYLNLLVQVGLLGLAGFLWAFYTLSRFTMQRLSLLLAHPLGGPIIGVFAGLVALLVEAGTDHVFWRPDIAGQFWWVIGMLLAGIAIVESEGTLEAARRH